MVVLKVDISEIPVEISVANENETISFQNPNCIFHELLMFLMIATLSLIKSYMYQHYDLIKEKIIMF